MKEPSERDWNTEFDKHSLSSIRKEMNESEKLLWNGKPKYEFSLTPLELGGYDAALGPTNLYFIGLGILFFYAYQASQNSNYLLAVVLVIFGVVIFSIPDMIKEVRRRKTFYAATNHALYFNIWKFNLLKGGKQNLYHIPLDDILDLRYEEYEDKSGTLYVMPIAPSKFKTYNFSNGGVRHYPTFENIQNVVELYNRILELKKTSSKV